MLPGYAELLALVNWSITGIARVPVQACVHVGVGACENQPWAIMKVTYVRGWTSPVCDVKLSCLQKRPHSYLEHTRRRANVRDVLSLQHLPYYWLICSCHVWFTRWVKAVIGCILYLEAFRDDIAASELAAISPIVAVTGEATELFDKYNAVVSAIVDKHAPLQSGRVAVRPLVPWFSDALADAKRERRRMERKWRHTPIHINRDIYKTQCAHVKHMIKAAKSDYFVSELEQCKGDTRRLYRLLNGLLQRGTSSSPPSNKDPQLLASRFAQAFNTKFETIRLTLGDQSVPCYSSDYQPCSSVPLLQTFPTTSVSDTCQLIIKSPSTTCALDPVPTWLLKRWKHIAEDLAPFLTHLINSSITSGVVPRSMKHAIVTPLLKKANLDPDNMTNYRPISNLSFASKLLERHVARCLLDHATTNDLLDRNQSAYRPHHSTETALVLVQTDILKALDRRHDVILILLDMSAAFDTVDHDVLVTRLEQRFGVTGCAIAWITSYLSDRSQSVKIHGGVSDDTPLVFGVPQGSALGPILFTMYTTPIGDIIRRHQLNFHLYADDTQLYVNFELSDDDNKLSSLNKIENCVSEVRMWMNANFLKVNEDKTVALVHASINNQAKHNITAIKIGDCDITPSPSARNIELYSMLRCLWLLTSTRHVVCAITIWRISLPSGHAWQSKPRFDSCILWWFPGWITQTLFCSVLQTFLSANYRECRIMQPGWSFAATDATTLLQY